MNLAAQGFFVPVVAVTFPGLQEGTDPDPRRVPHATRGQGQRRGRCASVDADTATPPRGVRPPQVQFAAVAPGPGVVGNKPTSGRTSVRENEIPAELLVRRRGECTVVRPHPQLSPRLTRTRVTSPTAIRGASFGGLVRATDSLLKKSVITSPTGSLNVTTVGEDLGRAPSPLAAAWGHIAEAGCDTRLNAATARRQDPARRRLHPAVTRLAAFPWVTSFRMRAFVPLAARTASKIIRHNVSHLNIESRSRSGPRVDLRGWGVRSTRRVGPSCSAPPRTLRTSSPAFLPATMALEPMPNKTAPRAVGPKRAYDTTN